MEETDARRVAKGREKAQREIKKRTRGRRECIRGVDRRLSPRAFFCWVSQRSRRVYCAEGGRRTDATEGWYEREEGSREAGR